MSSDKRASDRRSREKMEKGVAGRKVPRFCGWRKRLGQDIYGGI